MFASRLLRQASRTTSSTAYFSPSSHLWYRIIPPPRDKGVESSSESTTTTSRTWNVQVGITDRGLDDLGDITRIEIPRTAAASEKSTSKKINRGDDLARLHWEGFSRSDSDELYHAVWESIEGVTSIPSPVRGEIRAKSETAVVEVHEDTILAVISCNEMEIQEATRNWVGQQEYEALVSRQQVGRFATD